MEQNPGDNRENINKIKYVQKNPFFFHGGNQTGINICINMSLACNYNGSLLKPTDQQKKMDWGYEQMIYDTIEMVLKHLKDTELRS